MCLVYNWSCIIVVLFFKENFKVTNYIGSILKWLIILSHLWLNATDWQTLQQLCHVGHSALCSFYCWLEYCSCHRMSWQMQSTALLHEMIKGRLCIFRLYTDALYHHLLQESYIKEHTASKFTYFLIPFSKSQTLFDQYRLSLGTYKLSGGITRCKAVPLVDMMVFIVDQNMWEIC